MLTPTLNDRNKESEQKAPFSLLQLINSILDLQFFS